MNDKSTTKRWLAVVFIVVDFLYVVRNFNDVGVGYQKIFAHNMWNTVQFYPLVFKLNNITMHTNYH